MSDPDALLKKIRSRGPTYKWAVTMSLADLFWAAEASGNVAAENDSELARYAQWCRDRMDEWDMRYLNFHPCA